jgi:XapX domain-containing protein
MSLLKPYLLSLAAGVLVGAIYGFIHVRSPAPPVVALVGLLGILIGEQFAPFLQHLVARERTIAAWVTHQVRPHIFGHLPQGRPRASSPTPPEVKL